MKSLSALILFLAIPSIVLSQINLEDSTIQVIGYWNLKEKQAYSVSYEKFKVKDSKDTIDREKITYDVDITILDSTAKSYLIEWYYKNYQMSYNTELSKKLMSIAENIKVIIKTDEYGSFLEVENYKEVQDYIKKAMKKLKNEFKSTPNIDAILKNLEKTFMSKEAIQTLAIKDVHQFYTFHGAKYKLGEELKTTMKQQNLLGGELFDVDVTVQMDELNVDEENENVVIRMWQTINSEQLTEATYKYFVKMATDMGTPVPKREDIKNLQNETRTATRIHGSTGWIIYSVETKEVWTDGIMNVEERIIEIK
jgi:uncharacterized protein (DUF2132 family)